jgi:hypothetical protein
MVEKAINYLLKEVIDSSLKSKKLEQKYKNKIQNSINLIRQLLILMIFQFMFL